MNWNMLKKIFFLIIIGLITHPIPVCSSGNLLAPPGYVSVDSLSRWHMLPGVTIPETMAGICSVSGIGPVLGKFDTTYITDSYRILGVPEDAKLVIIKLTSIGVCRSDDVNLTSNAFAKEKRTLEYPLGHEGGGQVVGFSKNVDPEYIQEHLGKYAAIESHPPILSYWNIPWYDQSIIQDRFSIIGYNPMQGNPVPGTWSEYIVLPVDNAMYVSKTVKDKLNDHICLLEPNGNAVHMVLTLAKRLEEKEIEPENANIIISGLGQQGRKMMYIAQLLGMNVIGVDNRKEAVEFCISFGIGDENTVFWKENEDLDKRIQLLFDGEADAIIDASGHTGVFEEYLPYIKNDGLFMLFGLDDLKQKIPKTDIGLGQFVTEQLHQTVTIDGKKIIFEGICGRSKKSWDFILNLLEKDDTFADLINKDIREIGTLYDLAELLYPYNEGRTEELLELMKTKKLVMRGLEEGTLDNPDAIVLLDAQLMQSPLIQFVSSRKTIEALARSQ